MDTSTLICNTSNITYNKGYVALWLPDYEVPTTIDIDGETLLVKDHFHVSLLCVKNILAEHDVTEEEIIKHICGFIQDHDMQFDGFTGECRIAERDERMSLVVMCTVSHLSELAAYLSEKLGIAIPKQPAHVTMYTRGQNLGIGLNSQEELTKLSRVVEVPESLTEITSPNPNSMVN